MRSTFTLITFLIVLLSAVTFSQDFERTGGLARLSGMGGNPYVVDPFFVTVNPAWGRSYDNFLMGDLGANAGSPFSAGGSGQFAAAIFSLGPQWTLGGLLTRNDFNGISIALLDPGSSYGTFPGVVNTVNNIISEEGFVIPLDNNVEVMSTFTSGKTSIGLGVAYASTTNEVTPDSGSGSEGTATQFGFNLGIVTDLTSHFKLDAGASLVLPSASFTPVTGDETKANQTIIMANARAFWEMKSDLYLVPIAIFLTESGTVTAGGTDADMISFTMFGAGAGLNYTIGDFLLAGGLSFTSASTTIPEVEGSTPELDNSSFIFPVWNLGAEWNLTDWLIARMGYIAVTGKATIQNPLTPTSTLENTYTFFLPPQRGFTVGVGFRLGDFSLDATINEDVLRQGLNNIGGGGATFAYMSASYAIP